MAKKIKKGDVVRVVTCAGGNKNHIGKRGKAVSFNDGNTCVYWIADSCEASKVQKVKK